jgi:hypothetical protein
MSASTRSKNLSIDKFGELPAIKSLALYRDGNITVVISRSDYPLGNPFNTSLIVW